MKKRLFFMKKENCEKEKKIFFEKKYYFNKK